jgi:hypothetical protein
MKTHTDTMARLSAADPARDLPIEETERARLWQLIAATPDGGGATRRPRVRLSRVQPRLALIPVLLALSAGPLAASGAIRFGGAAEPVKSLSTPSRGGDPIEATVHLLPLTAPDPGGAQQWGPELELTAGAG